MDTLDVYQHFKGGLYIKLCESKHSENNEELVTYVNVTTGEIWTRPKKMFYEIVEKKDYKGPRFIKVPPVLKNNGQKLRIIENGSTGETQKNI